MIGPCRLVRPKLSTHFIPLRLFRRYGDPVKKRVPWGIHALTAIHGCGALALIVMALGCALSESFRLSLIVSPGGALMMDLLGRTVWIFLLLLAGLLSALCYGSWRLRGWVRPLTLSAIQLACSGVFGKYGLVFRPAFSPPRSMAAWWPMPARSK